MCGARGRIYHHGPGRRIEDFEATVIRFRNVCKTFGRIVAIDDLSFEIRKGEVFGLLGPNGAGKTTLVHLATGLLVPDRGSVEIDGLGVPSSPRVRSRIGVAPQALAVYEELSAEENLAFFARLQGLTGTRLREGVDRSLAFVGLGSRRRERVKTFSGGMKRRLNLAVALVHDPPILLLDEPTVGVDPQSRCAIFENVRALRRKGRTIVYTTHHMEEAQQLCDRVGILDHGRLLALDTVEKLTELYGGRSVVIAERPDGEVRVETPDPMAELARLQEQGKLLRFRVESPNLEAVFLNLTGRHLRD